MQTNCVTNFPPTSSQQLDVFSTSTNPTTYRRSMLHRPNIYHRPFRKHGFQGKIRTKTKRVEKCVVCLEKASGMYFGAMVCLPCKSFFIRCTKDSKPQLSCLGEKNCSIDRTNRMRCQYCRFQKCLAAGMMRREKPECIEPGEGQELCRVCCDLANGIHFGVLTCEGCKKFFRRALKEAEIYECKQQQQCTLNPRNRNACRYCRYQKCLNVGMSRQAIRMGRPKKIKTEPDTSRMFEYTKYNPSTLSNYYNKVDTTNNGTFSNYPNSYNEAIDKENSMYSFVPASVNGDSILCMYGGQSASDRQSPGKDSGIDSDSSASPQHSPSFPTFLPSQVKTEPSDVWSTATINRNNYTQIQASCFYQNPQEEGHIFGMNFEKAKFNNNNNTQAPLCYDMKTGQNEFESVVPSIACEIDVDDMNDILASLGQYVGNAGPNNNNNAVSNTAAFQNSLSKYNQQKSFHVPKFEGYEHSGSVNPETNYLHVSGCYRQHTSAFSQTPCSSTWGNWQSHDKTQSFIGSEHLHAQPVFPMYVS